MRIVLLGVAMAHLLPASIVGQAADTAPNRARLMSIASDSVGLMAGGIVVSATTGAPLAGAQVFLSGTFIASITDRRGRFRLDGPAEGPYQIVVRLLPYQQACVNVELRADVMQSLRIALAVQGNHGDDPQPERGDPPPGEIEDLPCVDPERMPSSGG